MRAVLLASATVTNMRGLRASICSSQDPRGAPRLLACSTTAPAGPERMIASSSVTFPVAPSMLFSSFCMMVGRAHTSFIADTTVTERPTAEQLAAIALRSSAFARRMGLDDYQRSVVCYAALLHDVGKIGIPDAILLKPGRLTPDEFEVLVR